ncbi:spore germination protein GerW family protein [Nocardia mexicana]|uniref:Sporulation protein YtfJ n=1 Tax=Nocardia mexicana TaxID=279262 RepID=A0A370HIC4_9NOCA|nr:spore germination protein GerW family protein [Nocardia mexicana]RDI55219.1 sporulation protein YtfJ [Nocardia mexicana]
MTTTDISAAGDVAVPAGAAEAAATLLERLAARLGGTASVTKVFGDPITVGGVTVVPVARAGFGFGGGAGRDSADGKGGAGGGGGGGVDVRPVGFIEIRDGGAVYRPIRDPWVDVALPLAATVAGLAIPRLWRGRIRPLYARGKRAA